MPDTAWHLRWQELLTGELWVEVVPGGHAALVEKATSADLAATIKAILCRAGVFAAVLPLVGGMLTESALQLTPVG